MTIKHSISKIQWAIVWALNYYLTQLSSGCQSSCQQTSRELETRCGKESHTRPIGLEALMSWGPEKMLIRCYKESQHPAVDPKTSGWASKRTRKTQRDGHNSGVKIWSLCSVSSTLSHANLEQPFRTLAIKWEVNIFLKKSSCVFLLAFSFLRLYHASFITASVIIASVCIQYIYVYNNNNNKNDTWGDFQCIRL